MQTFCVCVYLFSEVEKPNKLRFTFYIAYSPFFFA